MRAGAATWACDLSPFVCLRSDAHTHLADVDRWQSVAGRVPARSDPGDHSGLSSCSPQPSWLRLGWAGGLQADGAVGPAAGA